MHKLIELTSKYEHQNTTLVHSEKGDTIIANSWESSYRLFLKTVSTMAKLQKQYYRYFRKRFKISIKIIYITFNTLVT